MPVVLLSPASRSHPAASSAALEARSNSRRGAALLEVLAGLVVAALLLTPIARGITAAMHNYTIAASRDAGAALQAYTLAGLRAQPCSPASAGDTTVNELHVSWSATSDSSGFRTLAATLHSLGDSLQVTGADYCAP